jgi:hypothetical protein
MRYVYLRLFLTVIERPPLLKEMAERREESRSGFLQRAFSSRHEFVHRGTDLIYQPIRVEEDGGRVYCFGRIGKRVLASFLNEASEETGWFIEVNAMTEKTSFWEAVDRHKGEITRAEFTYVTPNVLGIRDKLNERLREYREKENATRVSVSLQNPKGNLNLDTEEVRDAVEVISQGGGSAKLKSGRETLYDSEDTEKAKDLETDDKILLEEVDSRRALIERFFR